jgi:hypothetical protein
MSVNWREIAIAILCVLAALVWSLQIPIPSHPPLTRIKKFEDLRSLPITECMATQQTDFTTFDIKSGVYLECK